MKSRRANQIGDEAPPPNDVDVARAGHVAGKSRAWQNGAGGEARGRGHRVSFHGKRLENQDFIVCLLTLSCDLSYMADARGYRRS